MLSGRSSWHWQPRRCAKACVMGVDTTHRFSSEMRIRSGTLSAPLTQLANIGFFPRSLYLIGVLGRYLLEAQTKNAAVSQMSEVERSKEALGLAGPALGKQQEPAPDHRLCIVASIGKPRWGQALIAVPSLVMGNVPGNRKDRGLGSLVPRFLMCYVSFLPLRLMDNLPTPFSLTFPQARKIGVRVQPR